MPKRNLGSFIGAARGLVGPREARNLDIRFEKSDIHGNAVLLTGAALLVVVWAITGLLYFYFALLSHYRQAAGGPPLPIERTNQKLPPEPRLQPSPRNDLQQLRAREDDILNHYRWIDQAKGVVGIPIDRAIELTVERGIPPQKAPPEMQLSKPSDGERDPGFRGKVEPEPR